jgi:hypothetical protein
MPHPPKHAPDDGDQQAPGVVARRVPHNLMQNHLFQVKAKQA